MREKSLVDFADDRGIRREVLAEIARRKIAELRADLNKNSDSKMKAAKEISSAGVTQAVIDEALRLSGGGIRKVINGTGVVLSTNLGRAPLPDFAVKRLSEAMSGYSNLEFDLDLGKRGERTQNVSELLSVLVGCQSAIVVNNNASAVMLAVKALSDGKETIVSRGELIEIGGSFRLPDVITSSGAVLKEVGTTNRTRAKDYKNAISERSGMMLKCHRSNYQITGFTEEASLAELAEISKDSAVPLVYDVGGGCFIDLSAFSLSAEPTIKETLDQGASLVLFSGDKLLGGPQAGIICGKKEIVAKLRSSPIYRALRADKVVIALIETVLSQYLYRDGFMELPVFKIASIKVEELKARAQSLASRLNKLANLKVKAVGMKSTMGGGSLPGEVQDSFGLALTCPQAGKSASLAASLRKYSTPVITTTREETVFIDLRTVFEPEDQTLIDAIVYADGQFTRGYDHLSQ